MKIKKRMKTKGGWNFKGKSVRVQKMKSETESESEKMCFLMCNSIVKAAAVEFQYIVEPVVNFSL